MALINCTECGEEVSDKVIAYPKCGVSIASSHVGTLVQTIEQSRINSCKYLLRSVKEFKTHTNYYYMFINNRIKGITAVDKKRKK